MKKSDRMAVFVESLGAQTDAALHPCYLGYFQCFNEQRYYEAHDVLEHLWLQRGRDDGDHAFFKGLIQFAGAFVHLKKQFVRPEHPKDAHRMRPAARLFKLAMSNLEAYRPVHLSLNVDALHSLCQAQVNEIIASGYSRNPWSPARAPELGLDRPS